MQLALFRTGKAIVLQLDKDAKAVAAVIHTLWPCSSKPRPCVHEVEMSRVKSFRATLLETGDDPHVLLPTQHAWRYSVLQVLAILDCEPGSIADGKVVLTPESAKALQSLQVAEHEPVSLPKDKRLRKAKPRKRKMFKIYGAKAKAEKEALKKIPDKDVAPNVVLASEIRRSEKGRKVIREVVMKILELDSLQFTSAPLFDSQSQECTLKKCQGWPLKAFLDQCPKFFQWKYFQLRKATDYGTRVHQDLCQMLTHLRGTPPSRKLVVEMIQAVKACSVEGHMQLWWMKMRWTFGVAGKCWEWDGVVGRW